MKSLNEIKKYIDNEAYTNGDDINNIDIIVENDDYVFVYCDLNSSTYDPDDTELWAIYRRDDDNIHWYNDRKQAYAEWQELLDTDNDSFIFESVDDNHHDWELVKSYDAQNGIEVSLWYNNYNEDYIVEIDTGSDKFRLSGFNETKAFNEFDNILDNFVDKYSRIYKNI